MSYYTNFELFFDEGTQFLKDAFRSDCKYTLNENSVTLESDYNIAVGESYTEILYFHFEPSSTRRLTESKGRTIINKLVAGIDLTSTQGEKKVTQEISTPFIIYYSEQEEEPIQRTSVKLALANSGNFLKPIFTVIATLDPPLTNPSSIKFKWYRRISGVLSSSPLTEITDIISNSTIEDIPLTEEQTSSVTSYEVEYRVEIYDTTNTFLASSKILYQTRLPLPEEEEKDDDDIKTKEKSKFPIWAAVLIAVFGTILLGVIGFAIYKFIIKKEEKDYQINNEMIQPNDVQEKIGHTVAGSMHMDNTKRTMIKGEEIKVTKFNAVTEVELETAH